MIHIEAVTKLAITGCTTPMIEREEDVALMLAGKATHSVDQCPSVITVMAITN
jgi:hypothetical protein